jgi:hypothetical protein
MKQKLLRKIFNRLGIQQGQILPRYARVILFILMPSKILLYLAAKVYNPMTDCYNIDGIKVSREWFHGLVTNIPSPWFRTVGKSVYGNLILQTSRFEIDSQMRAEAFKSIGNMEWESTKEIRLYIQFLERSVI